MNKTIISGRLTADAEVRETANALAVNFTVANNDGSYKDAQGQWVEVVSYFRCVLWKKKGANVDYLVKHLVKANQVIVEGIVGWDSYTSQGETKVTLTLNVKQVDFFGSNVKPKEDDSKGDTPAIERQTKSFETLESEANQTAKADDLPF